MSNVMAGVDQRTQLVGHNRLEMLLFRLSGPQRFGINVFKVREVIRCPKLTAIPHAHPVIRGIANLRGHTVSIMDLAMAVGRTPVGDLDEASVIVTEYNRQVQGFLVSDVDHIVNKNWEEIKPPPPASGKESYLTAVTEVDGELVEIVDVEKVLAEITGVSTHVSEEIVEDTQDDGGAAHHVLVVDDSRVARKQITQTLDQLGLSYVQATNGREALEILREWADDDDDTPVAERLALMISDVEMPEMDGYTLTKLVREDPRMSGLYIMLHTSLSGRFNDSMVRKVGADTFLAKYTPDELARAINARLEQIAADGARAA